MRVCKREGGKRIAWKKPAWSWCLPKQTGYGGWAGWARAATRRTGWNLNIDFFGWRGVYKYTITAWHEIPPQQDLFSHLPSFPDVTVESGKLQDVRLNPESSRWYRSLVIILLDTLIFISFWCISSISLASSHVSSISVLPLFLLSKPHTPSLTYTWALTITQSSSLSFPHHSLLG